MCTYNGAAYLPEQLASLAAQTRPPDELVVNDDRSDDGRTLETIKQFARTSPFPVAFQLIENSSARNRILPEPSAAAAEILSCFCDQDDVWEPDKLAKS